MTWFCLSEPDILLYFGINVTFLYDKMTYIAIFYGKSVYGITFDRRISPGVISE